VIAPLWALLVAGAVAAAAGLTFSRRLFGPGSGHDCGLHLLSPPEGAGGPLHDAPARLKLLAVVILTVGAAFTPLDRLWLPALLVALAGLVSGVPLSALLGRLGELLPFVAIAAVGALWRHDARLLALVLSRALLTVGSLVVLLSTTTVPALVAAARRLGLPAVLADTMALALRYLALLTGEGERLALAFSARAVGPRDLRLARPLGRVVGCLAVRAVERGERVHRAMLARGFDGDLPSLAPEPALGGRHCAVLALLAALMIGAAWRF
jgi:cobalt/nickel transport system permease protein